MVPHRSHANFNVPDKLFERQGTSRTLLTMHRGEPHGVDIFFPNVESGAFRENDAIPKCSFS
jgi:hypothetical protein